MHSGHVAQTSRPFFLYKRSAGCSEVTAAKQLRNFLPTMIDQSTAHHGGDPDPEPYVPTPIPNEVVIPVSSRSRIGYNNINLAMEDEFSTNRHGRACICMHSRKVSGKSYSFEFYLVFLPESLFHQKFEENHNRRRADSNVLNTSSRRSSSNDSTLLLHDQNTDNYGVVPTSYPSQQMPSIIWTLFLMFKFDVITAMFVNLLSDILLFCNPMLLKSLIQFTEQLERPMWQGVVLLLKGRNTGAMLPQHLLLSQPRTICRTRRSETSMLQALMGELENNSGSISMHGRLCYVPQQPWMQDNALRESITFGKQFDEYFYSRVLDACVLYRDLQILPLGDRTEIEEKGINMSGG
ncbi:unnamed protein product [Caenorhabditis sp. 36 PRJEB53466]|nr:unnamed protein product [Caenorhabditis sp. 36 PRJEB53466]